MKNKKFFLFFLGFFIFLPYFFNHIFADVGLCRRCYDVSHPPYRYCINVPCNLNPVQPSSDCKCSSTQCCQADGTCGPCSGGDGCEYDVKAAFLDAPSYQTAPNARFLPGPGDDDYPAKPSDTNYWSAKYIEFCKAEPYTDDGHNCRTAENISITDFSLSAGRGLSNCGGTVYCDCQDTFILTKPPPNYEFPALLTLDEPDSLLLRIINYFNYRGSCDQDNSIGYFIRCHTCDNDRKCRDSTGPVSNYHCTKSNYLGNYRVDVNGNGVIDEGDDISLQIPIKGGGYKDYIGYDLYYDNERKNWKDRCSSERAYVNFSFTAPRAGYYSFAILSTNGVKIGPPSGCEHCSGEYSTGLETSNISYGGKVIRDLYFNQNEKKNLTAYVETDGRCAAKLRVRVYSCPLKTVYSGKKPENIGDGSVTKAEEYRVFAAGGEGRILDFQWKFRSNFSGKAFLRMLNFPFPNQEAPDGVVLKLETLDNLSGSGDIQGVIVENIRSSFYGNFQEGWSYKLSGSGWNYLAGDIFTPLFGFHQSAASTDGDTDFTYIPVRKTRPTIKINFLNENSQPVFVKELKQLYVKNNDGYYIFNYKLNNISSTSFYYIPEFKIGAEGVKKFGFWFSKLDQTEKVMEVVRASIDSSIPALKSLTGEVDENCSEDGYCFTIDKWDNGGIVLNVVLREKPPTILQLRGNLYSYNKNTNSCFALKYPNNFSIDIKSKSSPDYLSSQCMVNSSSSSYWCELIFHPKARNNQQIYLTTSSPYYEASGYWTTDNNCNSENLDFLNLDLKQRKQDSDPLIKDIFLPLGNWFKTKDASFSSPRSLTNFIPSNPLAFDEEDREESYLIITSNTSGAEAGVVTARNNLINLGSGNSSKNKWQVVNYPHSTLMTDVFLEYVRSRKEYKTLNTLNNINEITSSGIYYYNPSSENINTFIIREGDEPLTDFVLIFNKNVKLVVKSSNFNLQANNNTKKSVAFIVDNLEFNEEEVDSDHQKIGGIFIAKNVKIKADVSLTENKPLKIKGNLVASQTFINERLSSSLTPMLFVVLDINQYMNIFPYLSISKYEWQEKQ